MLNPLRSEQEAFRFLLYVAVVVARDRRRSCCSCARVCERRPGARRAGGAGGRRGAAVATSAGRRGARHEVLAHRPGVGRRPRGRARDPRAAARPSAPTTACSARRARAARPRSGRRWIVDPLDGTVNFLYGLPGLGRERRARGRGRAGRGRGATTRSTTRRFRAVRGEGAELDGRRAPRARAPRRSSRALVATGFCYEPERRARARPSCWPRLLPRVRDIRRAGAAALDLACWRRAAWTPSTSAGSSAGTGPPGRLLVEEAGGVVERIWRASRPGVAGARRRAARRASAPLVVEQASRYSTSALICLSVSCP